MKLIQPSRIISLMTCIVVAAGCATGHAPPQQPFSAPAPSDVAVQEPLPVAVPPASPQPKTPASSCSAFAQNRGLSFLKDYTDMTPEERIAFSDGTARQIWQEEASFIADGWPAAFLNGWRQDAWLNVDVEAPDEMTRLLTLTHGSLGVSNHTRFEASCIDGGWVLTGIGTEFRWYTPSPSQLPGQDGDLTENLARSLVSDVLANYGTTRMRISATGPELERGRQKSILIFSGSELAQTVFPGVSKQLKLQPLSADKVSGEWLTDTGAPTGEEVLFERTGGLWKVSDHTEKGQWAWVPGAFTPRPFVFDQPLLGFSLGAMRAELHPLLPADGGPSEFPAVVNARGLSPAFDPLGRLYMVTTLTGGTSRGLNVGDPARALYTLYGQPAGTEGNWLVYRDANLNEEFRVQVATVEGVDRVMALQRRKMKG